jgi:hypothetical protein
MWYVVHVVRRRPVQTLRDGIGFRRDDASGLTGRAKGCSYLVLMEPINSRAPIAALSHEASRRADRAMPLRSCRPVRARGATAQAQNAVRQPDRRSTISPALRARAVPPAGWRNESLNSDPIVHVTLDDHDMPTDIVRALRRHRLTFPEEDAHTLTPAALRAAGIADRRSHRRMAFHACAAAAMARCPAVLPGAR